LAIRVRFFPAVPYWQRAPYMYHLSRYLPEFGVEPLIPTQDSDNWLTVRWALSNPDRIDILHFHWTAHYYDRAQLYYAVKALLTHQSGILLAKLKGFKIVWTMHNYMPHDANRRWLNYVERFLMARVADTIIVHCAHGQRLIASRLFRKSGVLVIPHGDFAEFLPRDRKPEARMRLGLPESATVLLFFGRIRAYKGLTDLLHSFREIDGDQLRLVVVGTLADRFEDSSWAHEVRSLVAQDSRVVAAMDDSYISDESLAVYLSAADVAVFPFRQILTSGSVITALSFGLPVVAPRLGCLPEVLNDDCGVLYGPGAGSLTNALRTCLRGDLPQMGRAARSRAEQLSWQDMVRRTAHVYEHTLYGTELDAC